MKTQRKAEKDGLAMENTAVNIYVRAATDSGAGCALNKGTLSGGESQSQSRSVVSCSLQAHGLQSPRNSPGHSTGVCSLPLLQGIFSNQGSNPGLPHCRWILYQLSHKRSLRILEWVAYSFSSGCSPPRNQTGVSHIIVGFFYQLSSQRSP